LKRKDVAFLIKIGRNFDEGGDLLVDVRFLPLVRGDSWSSRGTWVAFFRLGLRPQANGGSTPPESCVSLHIPLKTLEESNFP